MICRKPITITKAINHIKFEITICRQLYNCMSDLLKLPSSTQQYGFKERYFYIFQIPTFSGNRIQFSPTLEKKGFVDQIPFPGFSSAYKCLSVAISQ